MGKLLRARDILLLTLAGVGDLAEEIRDPMQLMGKSYEAMYGFIPKGYKRHNFLQLVNRNLKTGNMEKIIKNGRVYLRLTSEGKSGLIRDFPILSLTKKWDKKWVMVVFDISEKSKSIRDSFRNKLKSLGFGMLQKSVWLSPLSIGEDMREFVDSIGLSKNVFVIEIAGFILGDPKQLAKSVWNLEELEEEYLKIKSRIQSINLLIKNESDRVDKSEAKKSKNETKPKSYSNKHHMSESYLNELLRKKREVMRERLEFVANFPALPAELLSRSLKEIFSIFPRT